ncbi:MAG: M56 family metallopeptidase [Solirubrobacteraceae bacterium]
MRSARSLYRFNVALGALGGLSLLLAGAVAVRAVRFDTTSVASVLEACRELVTVPSVSVTVVAAIGGLSLVVFGRATRSLARHMHARVRLMRGLRHIDELTIDGVTVRLLEHSRPQAFCAGFLRPRVYLSTGVLEQLDEGELRAVVAHERHHQARRDPLRILAAEVLADALFFAPMLRRLRERYGALAELAADEAAVRRSGGDAAPLASALLSFGTTEDPSVVVGIAPERVDHLLGRPPRWELPLSLVATGLVGIGASVSLALGTAAALDPGAVRLSALVLELCMAAMVMLPAAAAIWALGSWARRALA